MFFILNIFLFILVGLVRAGDIDFGNPNTCSLDSNSICQADLSIDCKGELSGFIISPSFPSDMTSQQSGKV